MFDTFLRSTSGPCLTGASCDSTAPKIGSITSFAWQHGQITFRFSPSLRPMAVFYSQFAKKVGHDCWCLHSPPIGNHNKKGAQLDALLLGYLELKTSYLKLNLPHAFAGESPRVNPGAGRISGRTIFGSVAGAPCGGGVGGVRGFSGSGLPSIRSFTSLASSTSRSSNA